MNNIQRIGQYIVRCRIVHPGQHISTTYVWQDSLYIRRSSISVVHSILPWVCGRFFVFQGRGHSGSQSPGLDSIGTLSVYVIIVMTFCVYYSHLTLQFPCYLSCPPLLSEPRIWGFRVVLYILIVEWEESINTKITVILLVELLQKITYVLPQVNELGCIIRR